MQIGNTLTETLSPTVIVSDDILAWRPYHRELVTSDVTVPCHNEAVTLTANIETPSNAFEELMPGRYVITIADSGSTDDTLAAARKLKRTMSHVRIIREDRKGRGRSMGGRYVG